MHHASNRQYIFMISEIWLYFTIPSKWCSLCADFTLQNGIFVFFFNYYSENMIKTHKNKRCIKKMMKTNLDLQMSHQMKLNRLRIRFSDLTLSNRCRRRRRCCKHKSFCGQFNSILTCFCFVPKLKMSKSSCNVQRLVVGLRENQNPK